LPSVDEAWKAINSLENYEKILEKSVGVVICKYGMDTKLLASLNHMHYKLVKGENQINYALHEEKNQTECDLYASYIAEPKKSDVIKDGLIPLKWRINEKGVFESYEYLACDYPNSSDYKKNGSRI